MLCILMSFSGSQYHWQITRKQHVYCVQFTLSCLFGLYSHPPSLVHQIFPTSPASIQLLKMHAHMKPYKTEVGSIAQLSKLMTNAIIRKRVWLFSSLKSMSFSIFSGMFRSIWELIHRITRSSGRNAETIVKAHINLLHDYNEAKDATQVCKTPLTLWRSVIWTSTRFL